MAKFKDRVSDREESSGIYTVLGIVIIACVVGFIGFAELPNKYQVSKVDTQLTIPQKAHLLQEPIPTLEPTPVTDSTPTNQVIAKLSSVELPNVKELPKQLPPFPVNVLETPGLYVLLPFGGDAKKICEGNCNSEAACLQACARLLPDEFARRILPKDLDHKKLADQSVESCTKANFINPISGGQRAELKTTLVPIEYFEESEINKKIVEATFAMQNLVDSEQSDPIAEAVCYYQGSLVSALAAARAVKNNDSVSELIYKQYEKQFVSAMTKKLQEIRG